MPKRDPKSVKSLKFANGCKPEARNGVWEWEDVVRDRKWKPEGAERTSEGDGMRQKTVPDNSLTVHPERII